MKYAIALLFIASPLLAGSIKIDDVVVEIDDRWSRKDYTTLTLLNESILAGTTIYGSCFSKEEPDTQVFPSTMTGVTFINCNLDNVLMPEGNLIKGGLKRKFKVQNDLRDWEIDGSNKPIKLVNEEHWQNQGYSIDPKDIPAEKLREISEIKKTP